MHTRLPAMEGHTCCLMNKSSLLAIISGWGNNSDGNELILLDVSHLPTVKLIPTMTQHSEQHAFRYGFCSVLLSAQVRRELCLSPTWSRTERDRTDRTGVAPQESVCGDSLLVFGGCRGGGYSADCSLLYEVAVSVQTDVEAGEASGTACYRRLAHSGACLTRGYHSASLVRVDGDPCLLVFGGLHEGESCDSLELLHLPTLVWRQVCSEQEVLTYGRPTELNSDRSRWTVCPLLRGWGTR